jgi:hypothetical protein
MIFIKVAIEHNSIVPQFFLASVTQVQLINDKEEHTIFVLLSLAYLAHIDVLQFHPFTC